MSQKKIDNIKSQIGQYKQRIRELEAQGKQATLEVMGLKVGDRIIVAGRNGDFEAQVTGVDHWDFSPRPTAVKIKKDGTAGSQSVGWIGAREWRKREAGE